MKLDSYDKKILDIMQGNSRIATDELARQVGLSASAVQRRLKKLRTENVITREIALINPAYTGQNTRFIAAIEIERDNYQTLEKLKQWAQQHSCVQQLYYVTGSVDIMAIISTPTVTAYDELIEKMMNENGHIRRVTTNVVLDACKQSFYSQLG